MQPYEIHSGACSSVLRLPDDAVAKAGTSIGTWKTSKTFFQTAMHGHEDAE